MYYLVYFVSSALPSFNRSLAHYWLLKLLSHAPSKHPSLFLKMSFTCWICSSLKFFSCFTLDSALNTTEPLQCPEAEIVAIGAFHIYQICIWYVRCITFVTSVLIIYFTSLFTLNTCSFTLFWLALLAVLSSALKTTTAKLAGFLWIKYLLQELSKNSCNKQSNHQITAFKKWLFFLLHSRIH